MSRPDTPVDHVAAGIAHPLRRDVLELVCGWKNGKPWSPNMLSDELDEALTNVSYHVRILADRGLIDLHSTEPRRGALEHYYRPTELGRIALATAKFAAKRVDGAK